MTEGNKTARHSRLAITGAAALALLGAMGAGHAEPVEMQLAVAAAPAASSTPQRAGPHFVPSAEEVSPQALAPEPEPTATALGRVVASYYGRAFAGRPTASGEAFDPSEMTAAHRTLPFGSRVRVTNPRNGREVTVRINDRGPHVRGREIDLSSAAAEELGLIAAGSGTVELALLD